MTREEKKIEKEKNNFECCLCDKVIATSLAALNYHHKNQHSDHPARQILNGTYQYTTKAPKNEVPRKKRKHKTHKKVIDDSGNEVLVPIVTRWEETDAAIELYGKDPDAYLAELEKHYPCHEHFLDADEDHNGGVMSGGDQQYA